MTAALEAPPTPVAPPPPRSRPVPSALLAIALFAALLTLYTRTNTQPFRYHPDETSKGEQVMTGERNFFHPTMMLDATTLAVRIFGVKEELQDTIEAGRWVSAAFAAGCVVALALAGYLEGGLLAMVVVGTVVGMCPFLATSAHYMKEDTALMLGVGLFVLGARMIRVPWNGKLGRWASVLVLGLGCAVATSGKYVGAMTIPVGLVVIFIGHHRRWTDWIIRPAVFLASVAVGLWLLNLHAIAQWSDSWETFKEAAHQPIEAQAGGAMLRMPTGYFFWVAWMVTPVVVWAVCAAAIVALLATWRRRNSWDVFVLFLIIAVFGLLCACKQGFARYALPGIVLIELLAALGIFWMWDWIGKRGIGRSVVLLMFAIVIAFQSYACANALGQFRDDSRDRVRVWLEQNMKQTEFAAAEGFAGFSDWHGGMAFGRPGVLGRISSNRFAPQFGPVRFLRWRGFTYVVVCELAYGRYVDSWRIGEDSRFADFKEWYAQLFKEGTLVWQFTPERNLMAYTNPEIRVYRVPK